MTTLFFQIIVLLFVSLSIIKISCVRITQVKLIEEQREFDYFVLSLLWPATQCRGTRHCCSPNACCLGSKSPTQFTIHGLWANYNDDTWPACCTNSKFEKKEITCLLGALEKYWPTYTCDKYSTCNSGDGLFWAHEWEKHGTCSSPVVRDEYSYFTTTLNVFFKHNVTIVLSKAGYVASDSEKYPLKGIISAIQNAFHATPLLVCSEGAVDELRLCFYKDFKPTDCVNGSSSHSTEGACPQYVSLPKYALPIIICRALKEKKFQYRLIMNDSTKK